MTTRGQLMLSWGRTRPLQQSLSHPRSQNPHVIAASSAHRWQHRSGAAQPAATLLHSSPSLAPWRRVGALPAGQLDYWDVVEYQPQTGSAQPASPPGLRLGLVQQVGGVGGSVLVTPVQHHLAQTRQHNTLAKLHAGEGQLLCHHSSLRGAQFTASHCTSLSSWP